MTKIIAIMGPAGSGKSELRKSLQAEGYEALAFADPLKEMLSRFVEFQGAGSELASRMFYGDLKEEPSEYLDGRTPRHAMQTIGTEWRDMVSKTLYSNAWKRAVQILSAEPISKDGVECGVAKVVVDDLRFLHEAEMLKNTPGFEATIVKINRDGYNAGNHQSEKEWMLIPSDIWITNREGNPQWMIENLRSLMSL